MPVAKPRAAVLQQPVLRRRALTFRLGLVQDLPGGNGRDSTVLAWDAAVNLLLGGLLLFMDSVTHLTGPPDLAGGVHVFGLILPLVISVLGALIVTRQHGNRVGWLMMVVAFGNVFDAASLVLQPYASAPQAITPALWLASLVDRTGWMFPLFSFFLIPLYFPTGRPPAGRRNWI